MHKVTIFAVGADIIRPGTADIVHACVLYVNGFVSFVPGRMVSAPTVLICSLCKQPDKLKFTCLFANPRKSLALPLGELSAKLTERAVGTMNMNQLS